jgi:hypothetical protein
MIIFLERGQEKEDFMVYRMTNTIIKFKTPSSRIKKENNLCY